MTRTPERIGMWWVDGDPASEPEDAVREAFFVREWLPFQAPRWREIDLEDDRDYADYERSVVRASQVTELALWPKSASGDGGT